MSSRIIFGIGLTILWSLGASHLFNHVSYIFLKVYLANTKLYEFLKSIFFGIG